MQKIYYMYEKLRPYDNKYMYKTIKLDNYSNYLAG